MRTVFADPRVGVVKATPSHLKQLRPEDLRGTRVTRLIVGGEAFEWGTAAALQQALGPEAAIFNEYGPTEATIGCSVHRFATSDRPLGSVPIGAPIANAGLCLLDEHGEPVPTGMTGQIYISGVPLARGYLGAPELTRERFVDHPLEPGGRAYATGDRARYDARGALYYLGRADDQVKLNGVRVELAEIRAALSRLPRVRDSVVRLLEDERRNRVLVAYYVARQPIDVSLLRAGLLEHLPQEMLPHLFMRLPKLPLTLNGKIDLERLPPLEEVRNKAPQVFAAPRTATERVVAAVWAEILGVAEISVHSNFFELGGHSLLASQVAWKVSERLGVEMPLRLLFDAPTIAQVATVLDERLAAGEASMRAGEP
jgi:tyrocidine synthetase-3